MVTSSHKCDCWNLLSDDKIKESAIKCLLIMWQVSSQNQDFGDKKRQVTNDYWIFVSNGISVPAPKSHELPSLATYIYVYISHTPTEEFSHLGLFCNSAGQNKDHNLCSGSKGGVEVYDCSFLRFWYFPPGFTLWNNDDDSHYTSKWMP